MANPFTLYGGSYLNTGNVLEDPLLPAVRGVDLLKFAGAVFLLGLVFKKGWGK